MVSVMMMFIFYSAMVRSLFAVVVRVTEAVLRVAVLRPDDVDNQRAVCRGSHQATTHNHFA